MKRIDAQIHVWYSDRPSRPWSPHYRRDNKERQSFLQHAGQTNSPEMAEAEMAEAGVDGALLTALGIYGTSLDLEMAAAARAPDRFQVIGTVDPHMDGLADHLEGLRSKGLRGLRIPELRSVERVKSGAFDRVMQLCSDLKFVVMLPAVNTALPDLFRRFPDVFFFFNHLGTGLAPPIVGFRPEKPFEKLHQVLELADHANVGIKMSGAPALSKEEFPFRDIWPALRQVIAGFGAERVAWGSDYTRTAGLHSYWEGTHYLAELPDLNQEQLALIYGETLLRRTGWAP